jgi:plasmid maintenance system antidote protein VapI
MHTAKDLRVALILADLRLYEVAARVGCHPSRLGQMLRGRTPMTAEIADKIAAVLREEDAIEHRVVGGN